MTAVGYVRVSTADQADSGLGLEDQAQRIRAYCAMKGLELTSIVSENGVSGGKPLADRPGGAELLETLRRKTADAVVALKLDRMFRNAVDCLSTLARWDRKGVGFHVIDLGGNAIDTKTAAGRFLITILAGVSEMEKNLTAERTRAALAVKSRRGERVSGRIPFGFTLDSDGVGLIPDDIEQAVIQKIATMRAKGASLPKIAERLNQDGAPTKLGGQWKHQTVAAILARLEKNGDPHNGQDPSQTQDD